MEILFTEYFCKNCNTTIEQMRSVHLDVPHKLDVACPECNKKEIVLLSSKRMTNNKED